MLSLPTASVPGVDRGVPRIRARATQRQRTAAGLGEAMASALPRPPPKPVWSMMLETVWVCPAPGLEGDGAARARPSHCRRP
jgi:hypothetical protein